MDRDDGPPIDPSRSTEDEPDCPRAPPAAGGDMDDGIMEIDDPSSED